ncbi:MAG: hypothetical protein V4471_03830 [Pseudomonadota bacterium]
MKCFYCGHLKTIVLDSRGRENFSKVVRRRCCPKCRKRATTFEMIDEQSNRREEKNLSLNLALMVHYKSIINQLKKLEESIKIINPNKHINSDH